MPPAGKAISAACASRSGASRSIAVVSSGLLVGMLTRGVLQPVILFSTPAIFVDAPPNLQDLALDRVPRKAAVIDCPTPECLKQGRGWGGHEVSTSSLFERELSFASGCVFFRSR
jgi:hypothetical protein